ncbi:ABC transporter ATP-binding protein [Lichenifustis flavocetrariae]|uniref:ABC transporter ATP-binding protein n=1 Tax=Lichenifustis flavocetrariae TaxID=2949735 RepID=A0AA42CQ76_9HYPH|nr:ABC transporter ATP-binding protein [Lichenifustis flavocetrariae]MCW6511165.1 ABC transporter ATP-binding protein [Lichenifustis flavocetrariae]
MSSLAFRDLTKRYKGQPAVDHFDLDVEPRSFTVLCGPPKSGKSVLFRLLVGLEKPDAGRIMLAGEDITDRAPAARAIGYVPQSFALYPHLTVYDNIAYPLALAGASRDEIARRVDRATSLLSIGHLVKKTPDQLSGGEKQRTALARGLLKDASLFVLDDPLVGLDYKLRERLMDELKALRQDLKATFLYATSDSLEALTMAQSLVVIDRGRVVQQGDVIGLYHAPRHVRSLELVGFPKANVLAGVAAGGVVTAGPLRCPVGASVRDGPVTVGLRPEAIRLGSSRGVAGKGRVRLVENLGGELVVYVDVSGTDLVMSFPVTDAAAPVFDSTVAFSFDPADVLVFDPGDGRRLDKATTHG